MYAYWLAVNYRESYGMFICNGILFNHESPRRGETFVTKKISQGVAKIFKGEQEKIILGNLDAIRDWGYAKDYVESMWLMLQQSEPDDYVIATGESHKVRDFVEEAFRVVGIEISWIGSGVTEKAINKSTNKVLVEVSEKYFRPSEVEYLLGDASKANEKLGWKPKTNFKEMVKIMVEYDIENEDFNGVNG